MFYRRKKKNLDEITEFERELEDRLEKQLQDRRTYNERAELRLDLIQMELNMGVELGEAIHSLIIDGPISKRLN